MPSRSARPCTARSPTRAGPARPRAMRIFSVLASAAVITLTFGVEPSRSLDGSPSPDTAAVTPQTPVEALRSATEALRTGEKTRAVTSLQYAAEHGHAIALWQLGRIYADGE